MMHCVLPVLLHLKIKFSFPDHCQMGRVHLLAVCICICACSSRVTGTCAPFHAYVMCLWGKCIETAVCAGHCRSHKSMVAPRSTVVGGGQSRHELCALKRARGFALWMLSRCMATRERLLDLCLLEAGSLAVLAICHSFLRDHTACHHTACHQESNQT